MKSISYIYLLDRNKSLIVQGDHFIVRVNGNGKIDVKYGLERRLSNAEASPSGKEGRMEVNGKDG